MAIKNGDKVKVDYTGTLDDGTVFDSSTHGDHSHPLEVVIGKKMLIPGFENALIGMELNEEKDIKIPPKEAYGEKDDNMVAKVPKEQIPNSEKIQKGMTLIIKTQNGQQLPVNVIDIDDKEITLDTNHPLAGQTLNFHIKIVGIEPGQ